MAMNVAGTNAVGDYLAGQIQNTRILFGESPASGSPAPVPPATDTSAAGQLRQQVAAAQLANAQTLLGVPQPATDSASPEVLPPEAGQSAQQIESVGLQSSLIAQQFQNISTLFSSLGVGTNVNRLG